MKRIFLPILIFIIVGSIILILFLPTCFVLSVSNRKNPEESFYSLDAYREGFIISYTHSVNKGRVHDFYHINDLNRSDLILDKTIFVSYGAGIPEPNETPGARFSVIDNGYEISNLNRTVSRLVMAVGIVANHSIAINDEDLKEIYLTDYFAPQTSIILETKRISLIEYIFTKNRRIL